MTRVRLYLLTAQLVFAAILGLHWPSAPVTGMQGGLLAVLAGVTLATYTLSGREGAAIWFLALLCVGDIVALLYATQRVPAIEPWMTCEFFLLTIVASYAPSVPKITLLTSLVAGAYALSLHRLGLFGTDHVLVLPALLCMTLAFTSRAGSVQSEIEHLAETEMQARHKMMTDALTGLPNRAQFVEHVARSIRCGFADRDFQFAVLFIDLDGFKPINDTLGHKAGDVVLQQTAKRLQSCLRKGDIVGRYGGDEFVLLINCMNGEADAVRVAERVLARLKEPIDAERRVAVGASIGIALNTNLHERPEDLIRDADGAMYRAKAQGKNRYVISDQSCDVSKEELKERLRRVARSRW